MEENLKGLECPINWNLEAVLAARRSNPSPSLKQEREAMMKTVQEKILCDFEYAHTDGSAAIQKCSQYLTMAWLQYADSSECVMGKYLEDADDFMAKVVSEIELVTRYSNALMYLFNAMWAHFHYKEKNFEKTQEDLDNLTPFEDLEDQDRAAIFALKSCVFMEFGTAGHVEALETINKALQLENIAEWNFLKGKCMSRYRRSRDHRSVPSSEEIFHLRKAAEMKQRSASHHVFYGLSVMEYALYSPAAQNATVKDAHMNECLEQMTVSSLLNHDSPIILTRIAKGLMHMKGNRVSDLVEYCVLRSLELFPNSGLANHVAGNFYMYRKRDSRQAIHYLQKAALDHGIIGAFINLIDMVWTTCTETNVDTLVDQFWENFRDDPMNRIKATGLMASYYFFVKNIITKSISFWREVMQSRDTMDAKPYMFGFINPSDYLTVLLVGEAQLRLRTSNNISSNEEDILRSFLLEILDARPTLDIATTTVTREEFIRRALNRMPEEKRRVIAPKLQIQFAPTRAYRIPARRVVDLRERELPLNWRQT